MSQAAAQIVSQPTARKRFWPGVLVWAICLTILVWAAFAGVRYQHAYWDATTPIRFAGDIQNAYHQGRRASSEGLLNVYDNVAAKAPTRRDGVREYGLDYPPLRLTAAWLWYEWTAARFPNVKSWQNTWEFHRPLLLMNRIALGLAALAAFGLVYHIRGWRDAHRLRADAPWAWWGVVRDVLQQASPAFLATAAALLIWFSPPATLLGFGWPQWDILVPAAFLLALLAAVHNRWFTAGVVIAVGAMYKGQTLIGLPVLLLWPLVAGKWSGVPRFLVGLFLAAGLIAAPFMFHTPTTTIHPALLPLALALLVPWLITLLGRLAPYGPKFPFRRPLPPSLRRCVAASLPLLSLLLIYFAARGLENTTAVFLLLLTGMLAIGLTRLLPYRHHLLIPAATTAIALFLTAYATGASFNWCHIGFFYGTEHFSSAMTMGAPSNLPAILARNFRIPSPKVIAFTLGATEVSWGTLLRGIYLLSAIACGIAMGIHDRRRNPRFLVAAIVPWLMFVTFCAQVHERYPLYPALMAAAFIALGFGPALLAILLQAIALLPILQGMLANGNRGKFLADTMSSGFGHRLNNYINATHPGIGWALTAISLVLLFAAMDLRRPVSRNRAWR